MDLYPLHVFLTVAAEKSFSRAAERLLRTQPAVSLAVQRLEAELGEKLIDRSAKELVLTMRGSHIRAKAARFTAGTPPDARVLGAFASRSRQIGGADDAIR